MTTFWAGAALLVLLAVLMLATPLVLARRGGEAVSVRAENLRAHREHLAELERQGVAGELTEEDLQPLREEMQYSLLIDAGDGTNGSQAAARTGSGWKLVLLVSLLTALAAALLYDRLGAARDWQLARDIEAIGAASDPASRQASLRRLVTRLERKLDDGERNTTARFLLARSQMELGRYPEAAQAYAELVAANPDEPRLMAEYAQARFAAANRVLGPETADILRRVLELEPNNQTALGLLGLGLFNHGNYAAALRYWERALALATDPAGQRALQAGIARAREQMGLPATAQPETAAGPRVSVTVSLAADAAGSVGDASAVFVFARRVDGPRMPLAAARLSPGELPRTVVLDDRNAMMAGMDLSSAGDEVEVQARLTHSGQPLPQSGDWESASVRVSLRDQAAPAALTIGTQLP